MSKSLSIVGSSRSNGQREENDFYPTPSWCVDELLKRESFGVSVWECCCGDGAISEVLLNNGKNVYSTDIVNYNGYADNIVDFLKVDYEINFDAIITNPPYKIALDFVLKAKQHSSGKIAMFLKTVFLESESRYNMFQDKTFPLKTVYQFSNRVSLYKNGVKMKNGGMISYAWYVWDKNYVGKPTVEWILRDTKKQNKIFNEQ